VIRRALAAPLLLAACATPPPTCTRPLTPMVEWQLFMGGDVAEADWASFARQTLEPAFPGGFTVLDASGFWRGGRENSRVLVVAAPDDPQSAASVASIAGAYRRRFAQKSVGILRRSVCGTFEPDRE
jgi:hypothetical protein